MPSWGAPAAAEFSGMELAAAAYATIDNSDELEATKKHEKDDKKPDEPAPCATKPFGQCAGMNFTKTKAERDAYNVTAGAQPLACCPPGTSCVVFGPVWGMCMPAFGPPK